MTKNLTYMERVTAYKADHPEVSHKDAMAAVSKLNRVGKGVKTKNVEKSDIPDGFTAVSAKLPEVKSHGPVVSISKHLILLLSDGSKIAGAYQRWDRDMNADHIQAKNGDGYFYSLGDGTKLSNVVAFQLIN